MKLTTIFVYGFAVFAMFFGSGNLVFPLQIGQYSGAWWWLGGLGLFVTGIALPFLGLFVIKLHHGNYYNFFGGAGKIARYLLPLFTLSLLGSFGVVPRCITVAHGGISPLFPDFPLVLFSLIFSLITFVFCLKEQAMLTILGKWMCPILLASLAILVIMGVIHAPDAPLLVSKGEAFTFGFGAGYQLMDLFAAFFFSALIFKHIQQALPPHASMKQVIKFAIMPSTIGSILLALVYIGFVYLGAHYGSLVKNTSPELLLPSIATIILGQWASIIIGVAMLFSCLTTAVALNNIYARFLTSLIGQPDSRFPFVLAITTMVSFALSLLDFKGIASFLGPTLDISYPGLIALTIISIITPKHHLLKTIAFWSITAVMLVTY